MTSDAEHVRNLSDRCRAWIDRHAMLVFVGTLVYFTVLGIVVVFAVIKVYNIAEETRQAGCTLRGDQQDRYENSVRFLASHPNGIPGLATRGDLLRTIEGLARNVHALGSLSCDEPVHLTPPPPTTAVP